MTLLDLTIVNIAIPDMIDKLHVSYDEILWVVSAYILVLVVLMITAGRLGDLLGKRNLFIAGVAVFTVASLLCGLSQGPGELIAARAVQGLGAALLMPQTMSIVVEVFPPERRGAALGVWGAVAGVATIAGPTLGGFLVTALDWRWIFFVNLPIGALVLVLAPLLIPMPVRGARKHSFDVLGVALASIALFCLTFGLEEGQRYDWGTVWEFVSIPALLAAGALCLVAFFLVERSRQDREPLVPFSLFRIRNYAIMNFTGAALSVGMIGMFLSYTIYLQSVLGYSALKAGLISAPTSLVSMVLAPITGRLTDRIGGKYLVFSGLALFAIGISLLSLITRADSTWYSMLPALVVMGAGMGFTFAPMSTVALRGVAPQMAGAASGLFNTTRQLGSVLGTAAVGALLSHELANSFTSEATKRATALPPRARGPFIESFKHAGSGGLQLGPNQATGAKSPAGTPPHVVQQVQDAAHQVFTHAFTTAMHASFLLPIAALALGALSCLLIQRRKKAAVAPSQQAPASTTAR